MQRSDWFISQDDIAWFQDDPGNGDALLLATGKGRNHLIHQVLQSNFIQCQFNCLFLFFCFETNNSYDGASSKWSHVEQD